MKSVNGYSIGGSDARHNKHVVERLSGLIGEEEARVVIAGALHLNGAMIAAAHKDEKGVYTDHGNLVLKVGELFWQHYSALQSFLKRGAYANFVCCAWLKIRKMKLLMNLS